MIKRMILFDIPLSVCNLRCHYCYLTHRDEQYQGVIPEMRLTPEEFGYAMRPERVGGEAYVNLCADGETLLLPKFADYITALAERGHFPEIVSNMTVTKRLDEVLDIGPELLSHVEFKCSFHFLELEKKGLLDTFADNVNRAWEAGASVCVEVTPSDELIPRIEDVKSFSMEHFGALPHITIARNDADLSIPRLTSLSDEEHDRIWSQFGSEFFDFKTGIFGKRQRDFCCAGLWSTYADMATGNARQCYCGSRIGNLYDNPDGPINWRPVGRCTLPHCYNGHMFLTLGCIPYHNDVTYAMVRDRVRTDGTHWLHPEVREFFNHKLEESNEEPNALLRAEALLHSAGFEAMHGAKAMARKALGR